MANFINSCKKGQGQGCQLFGRMDRHIAEKGFVQKFINVSDFAESQWELYFCFAEIDILLLSLVTEKCKFDLACWTN